ncbi:transposase [bacterium]|nr:transposase [bacterium]
MKRKINFEKGSYYHVYNRGCNRGKIFRSKENYRFLLRRVREYLDEFHVTVIAYCFMPNHYHFLLRQNSEVTIGTFVQAVFNSYSKAFNKMYNRTGTLFESPFKSIHVADDDYLVHLCRYIHRNPLQAKLVSDLEKWEFSNYLEWINKRAGLLIDKEFVESFFKTANDYIAFVNDTQSVKDKKLLEKYLFDE